jgi:hypothetical protein
MSYATYDPLPPPMPMMGEAQMMSASMPAQMSTNKPQPPSQFGQMPNSLAARPGQEAAAKQPTAVALPPLAPAGPSQWADISDRFEAADWIYIVLAVLVVEVIVLFLTRFFPDLLGKNLNIWYNRFKLNAVLADIVIILIGFALARYVYTEYIYPNVDWNPTYFTGSLVGIQAIHDILFYLGVIKPIPRGQNAMMDVFKDYAETGGAKILAGDGAMMVGSSVLAMLFKAASPQILTFVGLLAVYAVPYVLETRNQFSGVA